MSWGTYELSVASAVLLFGGLIKGTFGLGLPMVATSLLALFLDVPKAVVLTSIPMVLANVWQAWRDGQAGMLRRFWPFLLTMLPGTWIGTKLLFEIDPKLLVYVMGGALVFFCGLQLTPLRLKVPVRAEPWLNPIVGFAAGVLGGLTSLFGGIVALYLLMLDMDRDEFIGAIGIIYVVASFALLGSVGLRGAVDLTTALLGVAICVPMFLGQGIGQRVRQRIAPEMFFKAVPVFLMLIGLALIAQNLW
jgi:uncharacterized membrane protein YfcA